MTDRKLTIQPKSKENVFGALPWITSRSRRATSAGLFQNHESSWSR